MAFLDNYESAAERIDKFWRDHPNGRIHTEIKLINEQEVVMQASIYTDREDPRPAAIDFAQETRGSSNINKNFFVENCSTSAIARALSAMNYQSKKDGKSVRPSREEMAATIPAAKKNWAAEATVLAGQKNVPGLRALYSEAQGAGVGDELLQSIKDMAKSLDKK